MSEYTNTKTPEQSNETEIPKAFEIFAGDINQAVITVQEVTGFEITPDWWLANVGNEGTAEEILQRFDAAFEVFMQEQTVDNRDTDNEQQQAEVLAEAEQEVAAFEAYFGDNSEANELRQEFLDALKQHLETKYWPKELFKESDIRLSEFNPEVTLATDYTPEEQRQLQESAQEALAYVDEFLGSDAHEIFAGMTINVNEELQGGGEAFSAENRVALNGRRMLMSLAEMGEASGAYDPADGELSDFPTLDPNKPGSALIFTLIHEMGHILDERTAGGNPKHRVDASEGPTKYSSVADKYNQEKDHEAFAEGFAFMVLGKPVSKEVERAVRETIAMRRREMAVLE